MSHNYQKGGTDRWDDDISREMEVTIISLRVVNLKR